MFGIILLLHFDHFISLPSLGALKGLSCSLDAISCSIHFSECILGGTLEWGFNQLAHDLVFRVAYRRCGVAVAMLLVFLASGLVHDLVISLPAGGLFGLPTIYFIIQGIGVLIERSKEGRRMGLNRGLRVGSSCLCSPLARRIGCFMRLF